MGQWYKYAFPITCGFRVKKKKALPRSSVMQTGCMEGWLIQSLLSPEQSGISEMHLYDDQEVPLTMESYRQSS